MVREGCQKRAYLERSNLDRSTLSSGVVMRDRCKSLIMLHKHRS